MQPNGSSFVFTKACHWELCRPSSILSVTPVLLLFLEMRSSPMLTFTWVLNKCSYHFWFRLRWQPSHLSDTLLTYFYFININKRRFLRSPCSLYLSVCLCLYFLLNFCQWLKKSLCCMCLCVPPKFFRFLWGPCSITEAYELTEDLPTAQPTDNFLSLCLCVPTNFWLSVRSVPYQRKVAISSSQNFL